MNYEKLNAYSKEWVLIQSLYYINWKIERKKKSSGSKLKSLTFDLVQNPLVPRDNTINKSLLSGYYDSFW